MELNIRLTKIDEEISAKMLALDNLKKPTRNILSFKTFENRFYKENQQLEDLLAKAEEICLSELSIAYDKKDLPKANKLNETIEKYQKISSKYLHQKIQC